MQYIRILIRYIQITVQYIQILVRYIKALMQYIRILVQYMQITVQYIQILVRYKFLMQYIRILLQYIRILLQYIRIFVKWIQEFRFKFSYLQPGVGDTRVEHVVQGVAQVLVHDNRAVDGQLQVVEDVADRGQHALNAIDLLAEEDVQRLQQTHLLQTVFHLKSVPESAVNYVLKSIKYKKESWGHTLCSAQQQVLIS